MWQAKQRRGSSETVYTRWRVVRASTGRLTGVWKWTTWTPHGKPNTGRSYQREERL